VRETVEWLERNELAEADEFEDKQKELEGVCSPVFSKMYQAGAGGGLGQQAQGTPQARSMDMGGPSHSGPKVEEVD